MVGVEVHLDNIEAGNGFTRNCKAARGWPIGERESTYSKGSRPDLFTTFLSLPLHHCLRDVEVDLQSSCSRRRRGSPARRLD